MQSQTSLERVLSRVRVRKHLRRAARALARGLRDDARDHLRAALRGIPDSLDADPRKVVRLLLEAAEVAGALDGSVKLANRLRAYLATAPTDRRAWEALIRVLQAAQKPSQAADVGLEALSHFPDDAPLQLLRAEVLYDAGAQDEARALLWREVREGAAWREALLTLETRDGVSAPLYAACGGRLRQEGDLDGALEAFDRALGEEPRCEEALEGKVRLLVRRGRWEEVLEAVQEALTVASTRPGLWEAKARAEEATGRPDEAIRSLQVCLRYDPGNVEQALRLGALLRERGRHEEAAEALASVAQATPDNPTVLMAWRDALKPLGRWSEVRSLCDRLAELEPEAPDVHLDRAESWIAEGDRDRATAFLEDALAEGPRREDLRRVVDLALRAQAWDLALQGSDALLDRDRKDPVALRGRGLALRALGLVEEALRALGRAARIREDPDLHRARRDLLRTLDRPRALLRCVEKLVALDPEDVEAWLEMARTAAALDKPRRALQTCERGLRANPGNPTLRLEKGALLRAQGRLGDALRVYTDLAEDRPDLAAAWKGQGRCLYDLRSYGEAREAFAAAVAREDDPEAWYYRGRAAREVGDLEDALSSLERATARDGPPDAWLARGEALADLQRWQDALHAFDQVLGRDPDRLTARLRKAEALLALGDSREALRSLEEAGPAAQTAPGLLRVRVRCLEETGRTRDAYEAAGALTDAARDDALSWTLRARLARALGLVTEARTCLARVGKLLPGDPEPRAEEAEILLDLGDAREALRLADEALRLDWRHPAAALVRARSLAALGMAPQALQAFDDALEVAEGVAEALRGRGLLLAEMGRTKDALATADRLVAAAPSDPESHYWKARILGKAGRWDEALRSLNQALYYGGARPDVLAQKALVLGELGRAEEGLRLLRSTVDGGRADPPVVTALLEMLLRTEAYEEALRRADLALGNDSRDVGVLLQKALALGELGRWDEAAESLELAGTAGPPPVEVWVRFAALHQGQGNALEAVACYDRALAQAPRDPELWKGRGRTCEEGGLWQEAARSYAAVVELQPADEEALCRLGRAYGVLGHYDEAREAYDRTLERNPASAEAVEGRRRLEERRRLGEVGAYARDVLRFEAERARPASREDAFRYCNVPMDLLGDVMEYVNEPEPLDILVLPEEEMRALEDLSRGVLALSRGDRLPRLSEVVQEFPGVPPHEARRALGYVAGVLEADLAPEDPPGLERLMKLAMELPPEERSVVTLGRELGIGAYRAKSLEVALESFSEASEGTGARARSPTGPERRCRRHGAQGLYQHYCGQYLCSKCIVGGRCPVCRHPVSAGLGRGLTGDDGEAGA